MLTTYPTAGPATLYTLLGHNPSTKSLRSGAIHSDLINFYLEDAYDPAHDGFKAMVKDSVFDCGELAIVTFLQAKYYGKPLVLLPATVGGRFQHHTIVYNSERGRLHPQDLNGKRIGVRAYTQTTVTWIRGILRTEYGVDPDTVTWVSFEEPHVTEYKEPGNVEKAAKGKKLTQMLLDGEIDATVLGNKPPEDARLKTLIVNPHEEASAWSRRTGIIPMNHMMVVHRELSRQRPDVVQNLYRLILESRDRDAKPAAGAIQMRPFGVEALRPSLGAIIDFAFHDGLIGRRLSVDELFDETTASLSAELEQSDA
ncbi:MAG: phosphate ABC transporter substrate-binding protein [Phyllobacterium sp.]